MLHGNFLTSLTWGVIKFGSSEELIDLDDKALICLPLGKVSGDRALVFYPLASGSQP